LDPGKIIYDLIKDIAPTFPVLASDNQPLPFITYFNVVDVIYNSINKKESGVNSILKNNRIQLDLYASTYEDMVKLRDEIINRLQNAPINIIIVDSDDMGEDGGFRHRIDVKVWLK